MEQQELVRIGKAAELAGIAPALVFDAVNTGQVRVIALKKGGRMLRTTTDWVREWAAREMR